MPIFKLKTNKHTDKKAIDGVKTGLINLNEVITWRAKYLGFCLKLLTKIIKFDSLKYFVFKMTKGAFKRFKNQHIFKNYNAYLEMINTFYFESKMRFIGKVTDKVFLKNYMFNLLEKRNDSIKEFAVSDKWMLILKIK